MFKNIIYLLFEVILLTIILFCFIENKLVIYGISQGKGQLAMIWNSVSVEEALKETTLPDSLKQKLILINEIKKYAVDSLGIKQSNNYTSVFIQGNKPLLWTVTACEPFNFKPKEWTFPFLGTVSYKGFFNKKEVRKEILFLKEKGYDVDVYSPSGWSTLGWFKDPIQSNMLKQSAGSLANLIIHELTHGTLYIKNNVTFNENLANFIGDKGAEKFLKYKYGITSRQFLDYENKKKDEKMYNSYMLKSVERLDSLYKSFVGNNDKEIKNKMKWKLISDIVVGVYRLPLNKKKSYFNYSLYAFHEGNAFFMSFRRYDSQYEIFEKEYQEHYESDLCKYLISLKKHYPTL